MTLLLAGLLLPAAAVWPATRFLLGAGGGRTLAAAVALGLGVGLSSTTATWLLAFGIPFGPGFVAADMAIWATVAALAWGLSHPGRAPAASPGDESKAGRRLIQAAFVLTGAVACATVVVEYRAAPHGQWDAWAIWNHRARFLFHAGDEWRTAISSAASAHADYPLLVPAAVARLWAYAGRDGTAAPALVAVVFGVAIVLVVLGALDMRRPAAWLAATLLLSSAVFVDQVAAQCADVPLAFFIVAGLVLLWAPAPAEEASQDTVQRVRWLLSGMLAGLAAWTKNEGVLYLAIVAAVVAALAIRRRSRSTIFWWFAGAAPWLATVGWFKLTLAPPVALARGLSWTSMTTRLFDWDRHATIAAVLGDRLLSWGGPLTPGVLAIVAIASAVLAMQHRVVVVSRPMLVTIATMFAGYYVVYVLTPYDVEWHVSTSADRLLTQLWPALVVAAFRAGGRGRVNSF